MPSKLGFSFGVSAANDATLKGQFKVRSQPTGKLALSAQDIEDIVKLASTEVDLNVLKLAGRREFERQTEGVVDTVLNRAYLEKQKEGAVRRVINAPKQFTDIGEKYNGKVQNMPLSKIDSKTAEYAEQYLLKRVNSSESIIGGHYNYFNPEVSNPSWGLKVREDAERRKRFFGIKPFIHYHGTADGERIAPKFLLVLPKNYQLRWNKK